MARAQTLKKKGRSSSSAKRNKPKSRTAGRSRRPTARGMTGSKGKGRYSARSGGDRSRSLTADGTGMRPEGSRPPTRVSGDATVPGQRRAASRQGEGDRTNRVDRPTRRKPGARGGGAVDRQRRARRGDPLETGRDDDERAALADPSRASTRGARPRGGEAGRRARARRATPRGDSRSAGEDRRRSTKLRQTSRSR